MDTNKNKRALKDPVLLYHMEVVPYEENIYWSWAPTSKLFVEEVERSLPKKFIPEIKPTEQGGSYLFFDGKHYYPVIWCSNSDPWLLAHELEHFVHWLLDNKGIKFCDESEEAYAYLLSFLMEMMITSRRPNRYPKPKLAKSAKSAKSKKSKKPRARK